MKDYSNYTCEDFADDDYFLEWVKTPDTERNRFWQQYVMLHPGQANAIDEARELVLQLSQKQHFTPAEKDLLWNNINEALPKPRSRFAAMPALRYAAAACLLVFLVSAVLLAGQYIFNKELTVRSAYAQKRTVILPDGSKVILNANSVLKYPRHFSGTGVREVWIEGEAYFDIKHLNKNIDKVKNTERFIVHTGGTDVEVLGTSFTVLRRHNDTRIALIEGRVQLKFDNMPQKVVMAPGELISHDTEKSSYQKYKGQNGVAVAWLNNKIILSNTPVNEVAQKIEDNYGVDVQIDGTLLGREKLTGEIPSNNLDVLLEALGGALNADITKKGDKIIIKAL